MKLRRHQLAYVDAAGWEAVLCAPLAREARPALRVWADHALPLVVTRQPSDLAPHSIALGWCGPLDRGRLRAALVAAERSVRSIGEFPDAEAAISLLPRGSRAAVGSLLEQLRDMGVGARVYGSYGWQLLSGLAYVHDASDLDVLLGVSSHVEAGAVVALLEQCAFAGLRIDGELLFPDGAAVAWREYAAWRAGRTERVLVKRLHSVALEPGESLLPSGEPVAA